MRVFTGTIPDYSTEVKGLLLGGVIGGGPAEQAGLQKGDVIVEIAGQTIANIYDYTYALEVLKIGEPAKVVYMRDGQRARNDADAGGAEVAGQHATRLPTSDWRLDATDEPTPTAVATRLERCPRAAPWATAPRRS